MEPPLFVVLAGPNGAGKSTSAPSLLREGLTVEEFVNADKIAAGISPFHPEQVAISAGRIFVRRVEQLARERRSFAFETTLAGKRPAQWVTEMRELGYRAHLLFLSLPSVELALARVEARHSQGGHFVPEEVIRRRFTKGLSNFFSLFIDLVDSWQLYDNAIPTRPRLLAHGFEFGTRVILDEPAWALLERQAR